MSNVTFAIDFGTTNSVLAVARNGNVEIIDIDPLGTSKKTLKSVLFFDEEGGINVGQEAIDQYFGFGPSYGRFMQSIKTFLPSKNFTETYIFGKRYEIEDLIALILKHLKHCGELYVGHDVDAVVLGRPVLFSDVPELDLFAEKRLRTAALRAGFVDIRFMYEPIAATLTYESQLRIDEEKIIFMGDFGGGTSDFAVMRLRGGKKALKEDRKGDILSVAGVSVAGDSFDASIMWHKMAGYFSKGAKIQGVSGGQVLDSPIWIPRMLCQWHMVPQLRDRKTLQIIQSLRGFTDKDRKAIKNLHTVITENLGYLLFRAIEKAKCELSDSEEVVIDFSEKDITICEEITRVNFEVMAGSAFQQIGTCIDDTLSQAGILPRDIDHVLLTGGSSFIPKIRKIFSNKFGDDKLMPIDAFTSVAYGLGLSALHY